MNQSNLYYRLKGLGSRIFRNNTSWLKKLDKDPTQLNPNPKEVQADERIGRREFAGKALKWICMPPIAATVISSSKLEAQEINHGQEDINKSRSYEDLLKEAKNLFKNYKSLNLKEDQRKEKFDECFYLCNLAIKEAQKDKNEIERGLKLVEVCKLESRIYLELRQEDKELKSITNAIDLCENIVSKYFANFAKKTEENSDEEKYLKNLSRLYISRRLIYRDQGEYNLAIKDISRGIELDVIKSKKPKYIARGYELKADYNYYAGNYINAAFDLYKVLELDLSNKSAKEKLNKIKKAIAFKYGLTTAGVGGILLIAKKILNTGEKTEGPVSVNEEKENTDIKTLLKMFTPEELKIFTACLTDPSQDPGKEKIRELVFGAATRTFFIDSLELVGQGNIKQLKINARKIKERVPNLAEGYLLEAIALGFEGKKDAATAEIKKGLELEVSDFNTFLIGAFLNMIYGVMDELKEKSNSFAIAYSDEDKLKSLDKYREALLAKIDSQDKATQAFVFIDRFRGIYEDVNVVSLCVNMVNSLIKELFGEDFLNQLIQENEMTDEKKEELRKDIELTGLLQNITIDANKKTLEEILREFIRSSEEIESKKNLSDGDKAKLASLYQKILSLYEDIKEEKLKELIEEEDFEKAETIKGEYDAKITAYKEKLEPLKELLEGDLKIDFDQGLGEDD